MNLKLKDNPNLRFSGITQLEYIESTGTQYIQTNFSLNLSNKFVCKIKENVLNSNGGVPFAATYETNKMFYLQYGSNGIVFCYYANVYAIQSIDTNVHEFILNDNGKYYIDGVEKGTVTQQNVNIQNFRIFDIYVPSVSTNYKFTGRIYFIEIYDGTTLLHNFIPVKDNNNVVCMYDTVSHTFFYNQGTGDFIAGPAINSNPTIPKITTLYINNCPNIDGLNTLRNIKLAQSSLPANQKLNRVRVDIGNVSGSLGELLQFSTLAGFNDAYEPQAKPRLVGTLTINDYYTSGQLTAAQAAFDGLTIVPDSNYQIDFNDLAVQTLDPEQPNYNPAVAIILNNNSKGTLLNNSIVSGGGRWFLTKAQAAAITDISGWFAQKTIVTDTIGIVSYDTTATYNFEEFDEFEYFGVTSIGDGIYADKGFNNSSLKSIVIPSSVRRIAMSDNSYGFAAFRGCSNLESIVFRTNSYVLEKSAIFSGCSKLKSIDLSGCTSTSITNDMFYGCSSLESIIFPTTLTYIGHRAFQGCTNLKISFIIPSTVTSLGGIFSATFRYSGIKELIIENGLTSWTSTYNNQSSYGLCANCSQLEKVVLPASLTVIRTHSFAYCTKLENVFCYATTPPTLESANAFTDNANLKIYVGNGVSATDDNATLAAYQAATNWLNFAAKMDTVYNYLHPTT